MSGGHGGGGDPKKTMATIIASIVMLIIMIVAVIVGVKTTKQKEYVEEEQDSSHHSEHLSSSIKVIHSLCQPTDNSKICEKALTHANTLDPKELVLDALNAAIKEIKSALDNSSTICHTDHDDIGTNGALETCREVMEYALLDLKKSVNTMDRSELNKLSQYADELRIWLSGALAFHETCFDALENTAGDIGASIKIVFNVSRELTGDGLDMVTDLSVKLGVAEERLADLKDRYLHEKEDTHHGEPKGPTSKEPSHHEEAKPEHHKAAKPKEQVHPYWVDIGKQQLFRSVPSSIKADVVVAKDGSGKYKTIAEALKEVPITDATDIENSSNKTFIIYIKKGIYEEQVRVEANMTNVMMVGDSPSQTKITGTKNFADGVVVYKTATVSIMGSNFIARDISFENSAPLENHPAVALLVQSDTSIFHNCHITGGRSTLFAHSHRQFYRHCLISGSVDFIFGDAAAVFQNCHIVIKKPLQHQHCSVAAQGRLDHKENTGFVLQNCTFSGHTLYLPVRDQYKAYFGRPWKKYSRTVIMQSFVDDAIDPKGWAPWVGDNSNAETYFFAEFENRGPGSTTSGREHWHGVNANINRTEAEEFTAGKFLQGDAWIRPSLVPYESAMIKFSKG